MRSWEFARHTYIMVEFCECTLWFTNSLQLYLSLAYSNIVQNFSRFSFYSFFTNTQIQRKKNNNNNIQWDCKKVEKARIHLKKIGSIGDIVPHPPLGGNPDLVLINRSFRLRLLYPLVPIHLLRSNHKQEIHLSNKNPRIRRHITGINNKHTQTLSERLVRFRKERGNRLKPKISIKKENQSHRR